MNNLVTRKLILLWNESSGKGENEIEPNLTDLLKEDKNWVQTRIQINDPYY